ASGGSVAVDTSGGLRGSWGLLGAPGGGGAGQGEEAIVALLHLLHHAQQERFTFPCGLGFFTRFLFPCHRSVLAGLRGFQLTAQQVTLQTQQVTLLLQGEKGQWFWGMRWLLHTTGAWCCILKRIRRVLLRAPV